MKDQSKLGLWSFLGLLLLLFGATLVAGVDYLGIITNMFEFATGNVDAVVNGSHELIPMAVMNVVAILLYTLAASIGLGQIFTMRSGENFDMDSLKRTLEYGPWMLFIIISAEELFARGLFMWVPQQMIASNGIRYGLFLLGNILWAGIHIYNYRDGNIRTILRTVPQFIAGFGMAYIFLRYGFWVALLAHFVYDVILVSTLKKKPWNASNLFSFIYYTIVGIACVIAASMRGTTLDQLSPWLNGNVIALDSFSFWDYALLLVLIDSISYVISEILLLDQVSITKDQVDIYTNLFYIAGGALLGAILIFGCNWIFSFFFASTLGRATAITILLSLLIYTKSGSELARTILVYAPATFFSVLAFEVLGFWSTFWLYSIFIIVNSLPRIAAEEFDIFS